jgi:hypothetical protein
MIEANYVEMRELAARQNVGKIKMSAARALLDILKWRTGEALLRGAGL